MGKMFECMNCGVTFDEESAAIVDEVHDEVHPHYTEHFLVCPACLSGDYIDRENDEDANED